MRHCHTHNTKVVHPNLGTVVGTAGQSNLKMQIIGEHRFLNALGKGCGIIASIGTDTVAHAGGDISSTGGGITVTCLVLIDVQPIDQALKGCINLRHLFKGNTRNLKSLSAGNMNRTITKGFCNMLNLTQIFGIQMAAGDTDAGGSHATFFGDAECVLFQCFCIDIHVFPP